MIEELMWVQIWGVCLDVGVGAELQRGNQNETRSDDENCIYNKKQYYNTIKKEIFKANK